MILMATASSPDHLFISYAIEDGYFADWLALKLASEGYKVWYDRLKLLGGESYPHDITEAIQNKTFRLIAILSHNSINKDNPRKERILALNVGKSKKNSVVIPINLDGLKPAELDFSLSDLSYISFHRNWFDGFCALLKKLNDIETPRDTTCTHQSMSTLLKTDEQPENRKEKIWSNIIPVLELPKYLRKYKVTPEVSLENIDLNWAFLRINDEYIWSFDEPKTTGNIGLRMSQEFEVQRIIDDYNQPMMNTLSQLLGECFHKFCIRKGLKLDNDGPVYFPTGLVPNDKLFLTRFDNKKVHVLAVGNKKFKSFQQGIETTEYARYHLSPDFRFFLNMLGEPVVRLRISVYWTDLEGNAIEPRRANSHRKALCKTWWNYQWLSRILALSQWLSDGKEEVIIAHSDSGNFKIPMNPMTFDSNFGIDEKKLTDPEGIENEEIILIDEPNEAESDGTEPDSI